MTTIFFCLRNAKSTVRSLLNHLIYDLDAGCSTTLSHSHRIASPHSTVEELYLAGALVRGLGSESIDHRLRAADFHHDGKARWLGMPIASLSTLQRVLVVGSNLRKDHPLFAQQIGRAHV